MADRRLQVFHAVAKQRSFTRAAEALFMTQPAVTFQIRQLEEQYRTRLFERRTGDVALTPAGELVFSYAERILALNDELDTRLAELSGEVSGQLLIGASTTIGETLLPQLLGEFDAKYPRVRTRLIVGNSEMVASRVAERTLDIGAVDVESALPGLVSTVCGEDELRVICAPDHPLAKSSRVSPRILVGYEYISREPGSGTRECIEAYFRESRLSADDLKTQMELGSPESLKRVVASGLGFGIVSRGACEMECRLGTLVAIPLNPVLRRRLFLIQPADRFRSRLVTTFIEFARQRLGEMQS
jgi:DNA-binding transcriptional LysR family regulator